MRIKSRLISSFLKAKIGSVDITDEIQNFIIDENFNTGIVIVSIKGSTGGITTIEYEPNLMKDYEELMEKITPSEKPYHHTKTWGDYNGFSHLRSSLQKTSLSIPFVNGKLFLGTWQQIIALNFDERDRNREILIQIIGE
jgi:secondary thiamine-phosphate synthase enzyme